MQNEPGSEVRVWDIGVRTFHWSLVLFYTLAYISEDSELVHAYAGYVVLCLIAFRVVWGLIGTRYARFSNFIYGRRETIDYLKSLLGRAPRRYLGHNPPGGWMIIALLITISLACWSGMELYAEEGKGPLAGVEVQLIDQARANGDREDEHDDEGDEVWEEIHEVLANLSLLLVLLHISGVVVSSVLHRENLVRAMITGYKKPD